MIPNLVTPADNSMFRYEPFSAPPKYIFIPSRLCATQKVSGFALSGAVQGHLRISEPWRSKAFRRSRQSSYLRLRWSETRHVPRTMVVHKSFAPNQSDTTLQMLNHPMSPQLLSFLAISCLFISSTSVSQPFISLPSDHSGRMVWGTVANSVGMP